MPKQSLLLLSLILSLSGCASSWLEPQKQTISVQTFDDSQAVEGIACTLINDRGQWQLTTPGRAQVAISEQNLVITCTKDVAKVGAATVLSNPTPGLFKYPITGVLAPVGAAVSAQQGIAGIEQAYPENIRVPMNQTIIVTANQWVLSTD